MDKVQRIKNQSEEEKNRRIDYEQHKQRCIEFNNSKTSEIIAAYNSGNTTFSYTSRIGGEITEESCNAWKSKFSKEIESTSFGVDNPDDVSFAMCDIKFTK